MKVKISHAVRVKSAFDRQYPDGSQFLHVKDDKGNFYMGDLRPGQSLDDVEWTPTFPIWTPP